MTPNRPTTTHVIRQILTIQSLALQIPSVIADVQVDWSAHCGLLYVAIHHGGWKEDDSNQPTIMNCLVADPDSPAFGKYYQPLSVIIKTLKDLLKPTNLITDVLAATTTPR